jgi:hypothetical protein
LLLRRNETVHGGPFQHPNLLLQRAVSAAEEFAAFHHVITTQPRDIGMEACQKWRAPALGWVKLNWDASVEMETRRMGYGALVRDERGLMVVV